MILRLDKMLAHCGYGTRKEVKQLIRKKNVYVNGEVITNDDYKVNSDEDEVMVLNCNVTYSQYVYIMLNKPSGVVSATFDLHQPTVLDLLGPYAFQNVFPVGRLDIDSEGLLLISNDGKLAHQLLSPKNHVDKTYYVEFNGEFKQDYFKKFQEGIVLEDGYKCLPAHVELLNEQQAKITIHEGKFHQVKRMFLALNMTITYLKRICFKNLVLDESLKKGEYRLLTTQELMDLRGENHEK